MLYGGVLAGLHASLGHYYVPITLLNAAPLPWEERALKYRGTAIVKPIFYGLLRRPAISRQFWAARGVQQVWEVPPGKAGHPLPF